MKRNFFSKAFVFLPIYILILSVGNLFSQTTMENKNELWTFGLKINVDNMEKAISFYINKLGFEIEDRSQYPNQVYLKTNDKIKLILNKVPKLQASSNEDTRVGLTLQVNDLDEAIKRMKNAGLDFGSNEKRKEGVGYAISFNDPFGRTISIMHETIVKNEPFNEPKVYNFGVRIPDMNLAREFYSQKLGFIERSQKYLPLDMPLGHSDKSFGFMLHVRPNIKSIKDKNSKGSQAFTMIFETSDLNRIAPELAKKGIFIIKNTGKNNTKQPSIMIEDPFGNISEIIEKKNFK